MSGTKKAMVFYRNTHNSRGGNIIEDVPALCLYLSSPLSKNYHAWRNPPAFRHGDYATHCSLVTRLPRIVLDAVEWYNKSIEYKSNHNVAYSCKYHVVWCPKYRRKVLVNGVDIRLKELIEEICGEYHIDIIEMEIMPDHIHLLMEVDPQFGIHKAVKLIKGRTSRVLRQEYGWLRSRIPSLWTNSYFVSTVGGAPLSVIKQYIENQKNV